MFFVLIDILDVDPLVDLAVALGDQVTGSLNEGIGSRNEEEVAPQHILGLTQLLLGLLKVEVNVQRLNEVGDGVGVFVALLANDADQVLQLLLVDVAVLVGTVAVGDDGGGEVAQDPGAAGLDGVDVGGGEEKVGQDIASRVVVEEGEQRPVDQPGAVLELTQRVVEETGLDRVLDLLDLLHSTIPAGGQNFRGELTPCGGSNLVVVGGEDTELVQQLSGIAVATAAVLEATIVEKAVDHVGGDTVLLLEELQVGDLVAAQVADDILILQQLGDLGALLLVVLQLGEDLLSLLDELVGDGVGVVNFLPQVGHIVGHVGVLQQLVLGADHLLVIFLGAGAELEKREDQMAVEVGDQLRQQVILVGDLFSGLGRVGGSTAEKGLSGRRNVGCHGGKNSSSSSGERNKLGGGGGGGGRGEKRGGGKRTKTEERKRFTNGEPLTMAAADFKVSVRRLLRWRKCGRRAAGRAIPFRA